MLISLWLEKDLYVYMTKNVNFVSFDVLIPFKGRLIPSEEVCNMSSVRSLQTLQQVQYCPQCGFFSFDCTVLEKAVGSRVGAPHRCLRRRTMCISLPS